MPDNIEELAPGVHAYVGAITDPWHRLGVTLDHTFTASEAMEAAHLGGWNVRKAPLTTVTEDGVMEVPEHFATIRTNPVTSAINVLGVVGSQYTPIQNEENATLLDALVDETGAHFQTAGALAGGRQTFLTMKLPESMTIGDDQLDLYIAALNSHDGSSAFRFIISPVRIVCSNTQAAAIRSARASFSVRHTTNANSSIAEARDAMGLTWKYLEAFEAEANAMLSTAMVEAEFDAIVTRLMRADQPQMTDAQRKRRNIAVGEVRELYRYSDTNASVRGTAWGGYQAVVEYTDHLMPVRVPEGQKSQARALRTATSGNIRKYKERAFGRFHELVPA